MSRDYQCHEREPPTHEGDDSNLTFSDAVCDGEESRDHQDFEDVLPKVVKDPCRSNNAKRGRGRQRNTTPYVEILTYKDTGSGITYGKGDCVYLDSGKAEVSYFICCIQEFRQTRKQELQVSVKWYYRPAEIPDSVYTLLVQDRHIENADSAARLLVQDPLVKSRELFISDAGDTYPVTALRGKCRVVHYQDIAAVTSFEPTPDTFFYVLGFNPQTKRLATTQGEIRVGPSHQARLPEYRPNVGPAEMPEALEDWEEMVWKPQAVMDGDLIMYLRATRSMAAFAGMCDGGSTEDGCQAASMDETTINALDTLHNNSYDTNKALQDLVKRPVPRSIDKKWTEEETKRFVKGLRQHGKNFFKIRKDLLPFKETGELVEYYYFWKKTPAAANNRPHRRHRRSAFRRQTRTPRPPSSELCDLSSASEVSDNDSDDSDSRDLSNYACQHCFTTTSKDWHHAGKDRALLCRECRTFYKKYGELRPLDDKNREPPPFMFKPLKEEEDEDNSLPAGHNMRTRRSKESESGKVCTRKERQSSPEIADSPLNSSSSKDTTRTKSPSTVSTCSNSSLDKEKNSIKQKDFSNKSKKRGLEHSESEDSKALKKKKVPLDRSASPTESSEDSSSIGGNDNEENGNDGDIETNQTDQDDLSSSASSARSTPVNDTEGKRDRESPVDNTEDRDTTRSPPTVTSQPPSHLKQVVPPLRRTPPPQAPYLHTTPPQALPKPIAVPGVQATSGSGGYPHPPPPLLSQVGPRSTSPSQTGTRKHPITAPGGPPPLAPVATTSHATLTSISSSPSHPSSHSTHSSHPSSLANSHQTSHPSGFIKREPGLVASAGSVTTSTTTALPYQRSLGLSSGMPIPHNLPLPASHANGQSSLFIPLSQIKAEQDSNKVKQERPETPPNKLTMHLPTGGPLNNLPPTSQGLPQSSLQGGPQGLPPGVPHQMPPHSQGLPPHSHGPSHIQGLPHSQGLPHHGPPHGLANPHAQHSPRPRSRPGTPSKPSSPSRARSRSRSPIQADSDSEPEISRSPSPEPRVVDEECLRTKAAIFIKHVWRGRNTCSRCDLMYRPLPGSAFAKILEKRVQAKENPPAAAAAQGPQSSVRPSPQPPQPLRDRQDKEPEKKKEEEKIAVCRADTPTNKHLQKAAETPPANSSADAQIISNVLPTSSNPHISPYERHTPGRVPSYPPAPHDPTPALRQLSEYARPHAYANDPARSLPYSLGSVPPHDPMLHYRIASMYPPGSRERLELELQRDKQERDERERELRERQLRELEYREKMKQELEMKPPGYETLLSLAGFDRLQGPTGPIDPQWLELHRRYASMGPGGPHAGHIPGVYPPASLASDLMRQERERLERLGFSGPIGLSHLSEVERMSAERLAAERMALAANGDPMARLQLASAQAAAAQQAQLSAAQAAHAHTHTHAHSHTHLHLHQPGLMGTAASEGSLLQPSPSRDPRDPPERTGSGPPGPPIHPMSTPHPGLLAGPPHPATPAGHPSLPPHPLLAGESPTLVTPTIAVTDMMQNSVQSSVDPLVARSLALYHSYQAGGGNGGSVRPGGPPHSVVGHPSGLALPQPHPASKPPPDKIPADHATQHFLQMSRASASGHLASAHGLPPNHPLLAAAAREQELLYRELLSRPPYSTDPILAHQLSAQAAHHEALQRQMAMERERLGAPHMPH